MALPGPEAAMKAKKIVLGVVLAIIGLPVLLVLVVVVSVAVLDRTNGSIVSSGKPRSYLLYVPQSYDRAKPTPLVISMHGAAGWPAQMDWSWCTDQRPVPVIAFHG